MRTVILNADDFGYEPLVTRGIALAMRQGVVSSTTMIVNSPFSAAAAEHAAGLEVGLHLNLVRFPAVSEPGLTLSEAVAAGLSAAEVERETYAQLERLERLLGTPATHVDVHRHAHRLPAVAEGLARAARATGLAVRSIDEPMRHFFRERGVRTNDAFIGDAVPGGAPFWTEEALERELAALPAHGVIELMCHPGYAPTAVESSYAAQREVELATFTSPRAAAALRRHGVTLASWRGV